VLPIHVAVCASLVVAAMTLARIDGPEALRTIDGALELVDSPAPPRTRTA
jgi:hypothetical protein